MIKIGTAGIADVKLGATQIAKVCAGNEVVWERLTRGGVWTGQLLSRYLPRTITLNWSDSDELWESDDGLERLSFDKDEGQWGMYVRKEGETLGSTVYKPGTGGERTLPTFQSDVSWNRWTVTNLTWSKE